MHAWTCVYSHTQKFSFTMYAIKVKRGSINKCHATMEHIWEDGIAECYVLQTYTSAVMQGQRSQA